MILTLNNSKPRFVNFNYRFLKYFVLILLVSNNAINLFSQDIQEKDSSKIVTKIDKQKSPSAIKILFQGKPGRALKYSLLLPGAGQIYNKKAWKLPLVYGAMGGTAYGIYFCKKEYNRFNTAYNMRLTLKENSMDEFKGILKLEGIYAYRNYYDYYYQFWSVMLGLSYLLNGIEAFVDRHLQEFNVSPDLSLRIGPSFTPEYAGFGVNLVLK